MIFSETWEKVLAGTKTQTRRPARPSDYFRGDKGNGFSGQQYVSWVGTESRVRYRVGQVLSVQPKRGQSAIKVVWFGNITVLASYCDEINQQFAVPLRIKILDIWREDVRNISAADVVAEGFETRDDFLRVWIKFYDNTRMMQSDPFFYLKDRPRDKYMAWCLSFERVR